MSGTPLCLFSSLKKEPPKESRVLFEFEPQNTFFQQILQGSSHYLNTLKPTEKIVSVKLLLRKLFFHMDYCVKDKKNCHLLAFLSSLTAREVFEKV
jgi:hypothetical protein